MDAAGGTGTRERTTPGDPAKSADHGFGRARRLLRSADFKRVFDARNSRAGRLMVMWTAGSPAGSRLGVVATKRTFRRAVDRARAKRLLREAFRLNRDRIGEDTDTVLVARRAILKVTSGEVETEFLDLARRSRVCGRGRGRG